jgi:hypothetical protein
MIAHGLKGPTGMVTLLDCHRPNYAKRAGPYPCAEYMVGPVPPNRVGVLGNDARRRGGGHVAGRRHLLARETESGKAPAMPL